MSHTASMHSKGILILVVAFAALLTSNRAATAADANGFAVCTAASDQTLPVVVSDGAGGAIVAWHDSRPTVAAGGVCYSQHVNPQGIPQWAADGVQLSTTGDANPPVIVSDGAGGAFVAFGGDGSQPRAQWVSATGVVQWGADGTTLSGTASSKRDLAIARDIGGAGGVIVAWREDNGSGGTSDIYAQKVNAAGAIQWAAIGSPVVATNMNNETLPALVSDGAGGAIVVWLGNGARVQRLNSLGGTMWSNTPLSATANNRVPVIASDGAGGAVVAWAGNGTYAQRVSSSGARLWSPPSSGVQLSTAGNQVTMIPDGAGGGIFVWQDFRSGTNYNVYAQRVNGTGSPQWIADGVEVCTASQDQLAPTIVSDGGTGAIITWFDLRSGMTGADIYAQRIDVTGASQWSVDGIALCAAVNAQEFPTIASDGAGGAFVVWQDLRSGTNEDIYSDRISPNGVVLSVPMEGSAPSIARPWPAPFSERVQLAFVLPAATQVELDVFDVNGRRVRSFGTNVLAAGAHLFIWDGRTDNGRQANDGIYFLRVSGQGVALSRSVVRLR